MKKYIILIFILFTGTYITIYYGIPEIKEYIENQKIKNATIKVDLKKNLKVEFNTDAKVSDFIEDINGKIITDYSINTTKVGTNKIVFEYINDENIKIPYSFDVEIIDSEPPKIWLGSTYTVYTHYADDWANGIMCGDNADDKPDCHVVGEYDMKTPGTYPLVFEAIDASGNKTEKKFTLKVKEQVIVPEGEDKPTTTTTVQQEIKRTDLNDVIKKYKNENTKIGIDVSRWQGDIDYQKVKDAGIEFVFIKVGGTIGVDGEYYVDKKFLDNIKGFNDVGIPVGVYIYTYAATPKNAKDDANWMLEQIKGYKVDLPIVYDWENWNSFNEFNVSFYKLTKNATIFFDTVKRAGYEGALYSSKSYLEDVWMPIKEDTWLAHYTEETTYQGDYKYWQLCDNGLVDGINEPVDIDIMYIKK